MTDVKVFPASEETKNHILKLEKDDTFHQAMKNLPNADIEQVLELGDKPEEQIRYALTFNRYDNAICDNCLDKSPGPDHFLFSYFFT